MEFNETLTSLQGQLGTEVMVTVKAHTRGMPGPDIAQMQGELRRGHQVSDDELFFLVGLDNTGFHLDRARFQDAFEFAQAGADGWAPGLSIQDTQAIITVAPAPPR
jgi:hypothetical protein